MKIKSLPKLIYVGIQHDSDADYLESSLTPDNLTKLGAPPRRIGVYELKEIKTIEAWVSVK